jgi:predicted transcriptional regulator
MVRVISLKGDKHMQTENIKQEAHRLLEKLPDKATWDDLMYQIYIRQTIEAGIKDSNEGKTVDVKEVRKRFGLTE